MLRRLLASVRSGVVKTFRCRTLTISNLTPATIVTQYDEGRLTKMETLLRLVSALDPSNVADVLDALPSQWCHDLRAETQSAPTDDWSGFRIISPGSYVKCDP